MQLQGFFSRSPPDIGSDASTLVSTATRSCPARLQRSQCFLVASHRPRAAFGGVRPST